MASTEQDSVLDTLIRETEYFEEIINKSSKTVSFDRKIVTDTPSLQALLVEA
jgi:hypothetical protein